MLKLRIVIIVVILVIAASFLSYINLRIMRQIEETDKKQAVTFPQKTQPAQAKDVTRFTTQASIGVVGAVSGVREENKRSDELHNQFDNTITNQPLRTMILVQ